MTNLQLTALIIFILSALLIGAWFYHDNYDGWV